MENVEKLFAENLMSNKNGIIKNFYKKTIRELYTEKSKL